MTTEQDYLELAEDCKQRINSKTKEIKLLKKQNQALSNALAEVRVCTINLSLLHSIIDESTKNTRVGLVNNLMRRFHNNLVDIDMQYQLLSDGDWEAEDMDVLTRLTISQLSN